MFHCDRITEHPVISPCDLHFNYILDETLSTNPIHCIETAYDVHQFIDRPIRVDDKTAYVLDVILASHQALYRKSAGFEYILSDNYLMYTHMEFENTKPSWHVKIRFGEFRQWSNFMWHS